MTLQDTTKPPRSVYLLQMVGTSYYKIGIAYDVYARLRGIQTGSPIDIVLIRSFGHENAVYIEKAIHRALQDCHVRGEWFECTYEKVSLIFNGYVAPDLQTTLIEGTDEESVVKREFIAEAQARMENEGVTITQIAREIGVPRETMYNLIKGRDRHYPYPTPDEEAAARRTFIDNVWNRVKDSGISRDEIERRLGESPETIRAIIKESARMTPTTDD